MWKEQRLNVILLRVFVDARRTAFPNGGGRGFVSIGGGGGGVSGVVWHQLERRFPRSATVKAV